jgi:Bacterial conjugation TrbI-like protein
MEKANKTNQTFRNRCITSLFAVALLFPYMSNGLAASSDNELNFKIYNPDVSGQNPPGQSDGAQTDNSSTSANNDHDAAQNNYPKSNSENASVDLRSEIPVSAGSTPSPVLDSSSSSTGSFTKEVPASTADQDFGASDQNNLKKELPVSDSSATAAPTPSATSSADAQLNQVNSKTDETIPSSSSGDQTATNTDTTSGVSGAKGDADNKGDSNKVLQGYVRVVPSGTKIPIIMDTAVDSDTSQEGDEFSARTSEDLTIDGTTVVPAGSTIKGRIATLNAPRHLVRSGSVALKFDTVTTPDNRQIPLVANLVARGGVVHAKRGLKDVAIDAGIFALPTAIGLGIGIIAGNSSSSSISPGGAALIGAGVGAAVGLAVLLAKKGKKVDVRPGDELKIELAEDLHMPTM